MAWTDACKVEAVAQINKLKEIHGGVRPAIREFSKESDIPYNTLQKWYHPRKNESVAENGYTPKTENKKQASTTYDLHTNPARPSPIEIVKKAKQQGTAGKNINRKILRPKRLNRIGGQVPKKSLIIGFDRIGDT